MINNDLLTLLKVELLDTSTKLRLTPLTPEIFEQTKSLLIKTWTKYFNDPEVMKFLDPTTPKGEASVETFLHDSAHNKNRIMFLIYHKGGMVPIGHATLRVNESEATVSRGIVLGEKRGQGIGKAVGLMLIEHARKSGVKRMNSAAKVQNTVSIRNLTNQFGQGTYDQADDKLHFTLEL